MTVKKGNNPEKPEKTFTIDVSHHESGEVPSITKLLNRKSLKLTKKVQEEPPNSSKSLSEEPTQPGQSTPQPAPVSLHDAPTGAIEPNPGSDEVDENAPTQMMSRDSLQSETTENDGKTEVSLELRKSPVPDDGPSISIGTDIDLSSQEVSTEATPPDTSIPDTPKIQKSKRRSVQEKLEEWSPRYLLTSKDPLAKGISVLLQLGATQGLFLTIRSPKEGSKVPLFKASACFNADAKRVFWNGLTWDPKIVPDLWNFFAKVGIIELSPPGANTYQMSNRNVVRAAFGVEPEEWLLILRAGPKNKVRGIVALIAKETLLTNLDQALPLIQSTPPDSSS